MIASVIISSINRTKTPFFAFFNKKVREIEQNLLTNVFACAIINSINRTQANFYPLNFFVQTVREIEQQYFCPCGQVICNVSLRFALIAVCAFVATLYADVPKAFSSGRGAIFERVRWTMKRECCVAVVKNFKGKSGTTAEIFGYHKRASRGTAVRWWRGCN